MAAPVRLTFFCIVTVEGGGGFRVVKLYVGFICYTLECFSVDRSPLVSFVAPPNFLAAASVCVMLWIAWAIVVEVVSAYTPALLPDSGGDSIVLLFD